MRTPSRGSWRSKASARIPEAGATFESGTVTMTDQSANSIIVSAGGGILTNVDDVFTGAGEIVAVAA